MTTLLIDVSGMVHPIYHVDQAAVRKGEATAHTPIARLVLTISNLLERVGRPTYGAACLDAPGPTWRHQACWDYKAKRKPKEPELRTFLDVAPDVFRAFGFPVLSMPGFEADDVLASIAAKHDCTVVSSDKDLIQCLRDGVRIWNPRKREVNAPEGAWPGDYVTPKDVWEKFGVDLGRDAATKILEVQALMGDPTDGIPGARGIGDKSAVALIHEYGTAEGAVQAAKLDQLPLRWPRRNAVIKALVAGEHDVRLSMRLATMSTTLDVAPGPMGPEDRAAIEKLMETQEVVYVA